MSTRLDKVIFLGAGVLVTGHVPLLLIAIFCGFAFALITIFGLVAALAASSARRNAAYNVMSLFLGKNAPHRGGERRQSRLDLEQRE